MPKKKKKQFRALTAAESAELALTKSPPGRHTFSNKQKGKTKPPSRGYQNQGGRTFSNQQKAEHHGQDELPCGLPPEFHRFEQYYNRMNLKELTDLARERKIGVQSTLKHDFVASLAWNDYESQPLGLLRHRKRGDTLQGEASHSEFPHGEEPARKSTNEAYEIGPDGGGVPFYRPGDRSRFKTPESRSDEAWQKYRDDEVGKDGIMKRYSESRINDLATLPETLSSYGSPDNWKHTADDELQPTFKAGYGRGYDHGFDDAIEELDGGTLQSRTEHLEKHLKNVAAAEESEECAVARRDDDRGHLQNTDQDHDEGQDYSSDDGDHDYCEEQLEDSWSRYTDKLKPSYEDGYDSGHADGRNASVYERSLHPFLAGHDDGFNDGFYEDDSYSESCSESDHDEDH